jgi:hypothetical protein
MKTLFGIARSRIALLLALSIVFGGCTGLKIAPDLVGSVRPNEKPITSSAYETTVTINPNINNDEGIDQSVQESLDMALDSAKIFTAGGASKYKIKADILIASEAAWSFGSFDNKLQIRYTVINPSGHELIDKTIYTEAGSDHFIFYGGARHQRARAVNMAKNVTEFVEFLRTDGGIN